METKLDLVLRSFAEDSNLPNYRKRSMLARGVAGAGASVLGVALASILKDDPELMNLSWVAAPATGLLVGAKRSRDLDRDQLEIDLKGRENIDKYKTYLNLTNQNSSPSPDVYALDKFLPQNEVYKLNERYGKALGNYPIDASNGIDAKFANNKSEREKLGIKLMEDKVDLFLNNQKLKKDRTVSFKKEFSGLDDFSEGSKLSTALKVAGVAGAVGALGAGALAGNAILDKVGDVAGDALGKVGDVTKEVLSNSSRVGKVVKAAKEVSGAMKG